ncbi:FecR family protein [Pseudomonas fontis]|uniref:FecR family protein n=1 Tax=Pseudomonas fontis TaxID=2942633 RepID=A0ABT5NNX4_9PSED|nr:FecR family protein [Pseudomonas fontis]MDD0973080.1 FecR family protein [Pseudomonas fontis]MDD0989849.1 FecR family protein [Pseudomonas fontis]
MNQAICPCGNDAVRDQAAEWFARGRDAPLAGEALAQFDAWRAEHPQHQHEYDLLRCLWGAADLLQPERLEALCAPDPVRVLPGRRRLLHQALAAGVVAAAVGLGWFGWQQHQLNYQDQLQTGLGERRQLSLPDGSQLEINGRTRLQVRFSAGQRDILLEQGEVMFSVAHDTGRPFVVNTGNGSVTVTGTRFDVRRDAEQTRVAVEQGSVRVQGQGDSLALLSPGLGAHIDAQGRVTQPYAVDPAAVTAWRQGKLVFNDVALSDVVQEVSRYREHPLRVAPGKIAALRLSSSFSSDDTDALLRALPSILPVAIQQHADGSSEIISK